MKVAVSTENNSVSAHFGRCPTYTVFEIKENKIIHQEEIANPGHEPGFLPRFLAEKGVNTIIAGGMGPRAQNLFSQSNIAVVVGVQGAVDEVIKQYLADELKVGTDLCGHQHSEGHQCSDDHAEQQVPFQPGSKICITAKGKDFEAEIDPRFGRAEFFLILDPIAMQMEVIANPYKDAAQGAGIQSAQLVANKGVNVIISGHVGPKAEGVLQSAGIQMVSGASGKVEDVIQSFAKGVQ